MAFAPGVVPCCGCFGCTGGHTLKAERTEVVAAWDKPRPGATGIKKAP